MTSLFNIIGYDAKVSEPNGPVVHGYFVDSWGKEAQENFDKWLAEHDAEAEAKLQATKDALIQSLHFQSKLTKYRDAVTAVLGALAELRTSCDSLPDNDIGNAYRICTQIDVKCIEQTIQSAIGE